MTAILQAQSGGFRMRFPHEGHLQDPLDGFSPKPHPSPADKSLKDPRNSLTLACRTRSYSLSKIKAIQTPSISDNRGNIIQPCERAWTGPAGTAGLPCLQEMQPERNEMFYRLKRSLSIHRQSSPTKFFLMDHMFFEDIGNKRNV